MAGHTRELLRRAHAHTAADLAENNDVWGTTSSNLTSYGMYLGLPLVSDDRLPAYTAVTKFAEDLRLLEKTHPEGLVCMDIMSYGAALRLSNLCGVSIGLTDKRNDDQKQSDGSEGREQITGSVFDQNVWREAKAYLERHNLEGFGAIFCRPVLGRMSMMRNPELLYLLLQKVYSLMHPNLSRFYCENLDYPEAAYSPNKPPCKERLLDLNQHGIPVVNAANAFVLTRNSESPKRITTQMFSN